MTKTPKEIDNDFHKYCLIEYLNVVPSAVTTCDPMLALTAAGIEGFRADFVGLSESDIQSLRVPGATPADEGKLLPVATRRKLIQVL